MTRNVWCSHYRECLDKAIATGAPGFSCQGCFYQGDQGTRPHTPAEILEEAVLCIQLIKQVFSLDMSI